jgi:hypothetical protein
VGVKERRSNCCDQTNDKRSNHQHGSRDIMDTNIGGNEQVFSIVTILNKVAWKVE